MKNWIILFCLIVAVFAAATLIYVLVSAIRELIRRHEENTEQLYINQYTDISSVQSARQENNAAVVAAAEKTETEENAAQAVAPRSSAAYNKRNPVDRLKLLLIAGAVYTVTGALVWRAASYQQDED